MNNNDQSSGSDSTQSGRLSTVISIAEKIYARILSISGLAAVAVLLVPVAGILLYAVFVDSREKVLLAGNGKMDAAIVAYENGEVDESLQILKEIRNDFPEFKIAQVAEYYEGAILFGLEKDLESLELMEHFLSVSSDTILNPEAVFMAGVSSFRLQRWEKAAMYFERLTATGGTPYEKRVLPLLVNTYMKTGDTEKAELAYARFINSFPESDRETSK